jgi:hypothetical protein
MAEQPPNGTSPELAEYLCRQLDTIQRALSIQQKPPLLSLVPLKPIVGRSYYFTMALDLNITAEGLWLYKSTGWVQLG